GISHRTAPVELRERIDFQSRGLESALRTLAAQAALREAVILSTCNRAELYGVCDELESGRTASVNFIAEFHGLDRQSLQPHVYHLADLDVARHLFRVAAGLDSLVV